MSMQLYNLNKSNNDLNTKFINDFKHVYQGSKEIPLLSSFRALLNGPFIPYKPDIPNVEALRAFINMIKCVCVYKQFNFADIPYIDKRTKKIADPFIVKILKWNPSRNLTYKLQKRQRELSKRKVYRVTASTLANDTLKNLFWSCKSHTRSYNHFLDLLQPFKIVVDKFKISKQVDAVIMLIKGDLILQQLQRNKLITSLSGQNIEQLTKNPIFYNSR